MALGLHPHVIVPRIIVPVCMSRSSYPNFPSIVSLSRLSYFISRLPSLSFWFPISLSSISSLLVLSNFFSHRPSLVPYYANLIFSPSPSPVSCSLLEHSFFPLVCLSTCYLVPLLLAIVIESNQILVAIKYHSLELFKLFMSCVHYCGTHRKCQPPCYVMSCLRS